MLSKVLILDCETTGLDPAKDAVIEVGCILYDVPNATPCEHFSALVFGTENGAEAVNRIPVAALASARPAAKVWDDVAGLVGRADAFLAHNAAFDHGFTPEPVRRLAPWICTKSDLLWPSSKVGASLVNVALDHGLGVSHAHRALTDCDLISRLLTRLAERGTDLQAFLARGLRPKARFVSTAPFERKDEVKAHGFAWDSASRVWWRDMAIEDAAALPFGTRPF